MLFRSQIFDHALEKQLVLKGICTKDEWHEFKEDVYYDYVKDNNFTELRDAELLQQRLGLLQLVDPYLGRYYSAEWVKKNVLQMDEDEIQNMQKQMDDEAEQGVGQPMAMDQQQEQVSPEQYPPEDNTGDQSSTESQTPQLDAEVDKYASLLNKR